MSDSVMLSADQIKKLCNVLQGSTNGKRNIKYYLIQNTKDSFPADFCKIFEDEAKILKNIKDYEITDVDDALFKMSCFKHYEYLLGTKLIKKIQSDYDFSLQVAEKLFDKDSCYKIKSDMREKICKALISQGIYNKGITDFCLKHPALFNLWLNDHQDKLKDFDFIKKILNKQSSNYYIIKHIINLLSDQELLFFLNCKNYSAINFIKQRIE